jgi:hypothetical protein
MLLKFGSKATLKLRNLSLKKRAKTVLNLTAMFGLIEAGIKVFEEINSNEQRATT